MIPTVTKYEFPTPLQLEDICKNENTCFFQEKKCVLVFADIFDLERSWELIFGHRRDHN